MQNLTGNPHASDAVEQMEVVGDMTTQEVIQAEATLALAHEQRTANLIAHAALCLQSAQLQLAHGAEISDEFAETDLAIQARMGLDVAPDPIEQAAADLERRASRAIDPAIAERLREQADAVRAGAARARKAAE